MATTVKQGVMVVQFFVVLFIIGESLGQDYNDNVDKCLGTIDQCYCSDFVIDCNGAKFVNLSEISSYINENTTRVSITNGHLRILPKNLFQSVDSINVLNRLKFLNLSGNDIEMVEYSAFQNLPNLETLDLSRNKISIDLCSADNEVADALRSLDKLEQLYLGQAFYLNSVDTCDTGNIFYNTSMENLNTLDLSSNTFKVAGPLLIDTFFCKQYKLTTLDLSNNKFNRLPIGDCMVNLEIVDISNNGIMYLTAIETDVLERLMTAKVIRLGGNPFPCDCSIKQTVEWLKTTEVSLDFDNIFCKSTYDQFNRLSLMRFNFTEICEEPRISNCSGSPPTDLSKATLNAVVATAFIVLLLTVTTTTIIICKRRQHRYPRDNVSKSTEYNRMV